MTHSDEVFSAFLLKYAASEDKIRDIWTQIEQEQDRLLVCLPLVSSPLLSATGFPRSISVDSATWLSICSTFDHWSTEYSNEQTLAATGQTINVDSGKRLEGAYTVGLHKTRGACQGR